MTQQNYYYHDFSDDLVNSHEQSYQLPAHYEILPNTIGANCWATTVKLLGKIIAWPYAKFYLRSKIIGREKLRRVKGQGYFVYGNHTQPLGDAVDPLAIFPIKNYHVIAAKANWGISIIGKIALPFVGLPIGNTAKETNLLLKAIKEVVDEQRGIVMIYPEAHVWPYYTKVRPFNATSMHFPVALKKPSFVMTTTYQKATWGKRPKMVVYLDGPFYPDKDLPRKQAQKKLYRQISTIMNYRAANSNYQYRNYQRVN